MSTLISSFIIDPVVRQARRFSAAVPNPEDSNSPARRLSHVNPPPRPPSLAAAPNTNVDLNGDATTTVAGQGLPQISDGSAAIDAFQQYSSSIRRNRSASGPAATSSQYADQRLENDAFSTAEAPPLSLSDPPSPLPVVASVVDGGMSQNPSLDIHQHFRRLDLSPLPTTVANAPPSDESRSRAGSGESALNALNMSGSLPEDDGMRHLRARIHQIRDLKAPSDEKARLMHVLMTERYNLLKPQSPLILLPNERPFTPTSPQSFLESDLHLSSPISLNLEVDARNPYNLGPEDTDPTFRMNVNEEDPEEEEGEITLGCVHYKRNVKVQCYQCRRWYTCRHCHDAKETHNLDRRKTQNMLCMACGTPQPAGHTCRQCGTEAAWYYCDICKLWDDAPNKRIYHCDDCGICRQGEGLGKDYFHCKRCNVCIAIAFAETHRCIERATECDCPICGEYLFNSSSAVVSMPCGHYLHKDCYDLYMQTAYKCPICKKSAVNMELQWQKITDAIQTQPMPEQFADTRVIIQCNDCSARSSVKYHWLGNQCKECDSYNTNELRLLTGPESEQAANDIISNDAANLDPRDTLAPPTATSPSEQPARPASQLRPHSPRSYFLQDPEDPSRSPTSDQGSSFQYPSLPYPSLPGIPYHVLERMRSFSPSTAGLEDTLPYQMFERVRGSLSPYMFERVNRSIAPYVGDPITSTGEPNTSFPFQMYERFSRSLSPYIGEQASTANGDPSPSLPAQMYERFSRSLSPFRNYLNQSNENVIDANLADRPDDEQMAFWGGDGWFLSGGEEDGDDDDDDDDDDENSESSDESMTEDEEAIEDEGEEGDEDDMELFGHR